MNIIDKVRCLFQRVRKLEKQVSEEPDVINISDVVGLTQELEDKADFTELPEANELLSKPEIAALVSPTTDYVDLTEATAAIKSIIDALKA